MSAARRRRSHNVRRATGAATAAVVAIGLVSFAPTAQGQERPVPTANQSSEIHRQGGKPLFAKSDGSAVGLVRAYLKSQGLGRETATSVQASGALWKTRGVGHLRMSQYVDGLRVHDTYAKAAFNASGKLVDLVENIAAVPQGGPKAASVDSADALRAAVSSLYPNRSADTRETGSEGNTTSFAKGGFHAAPTVERVAVPTSGGGMAVGYVVTTWTTDDNQLHETLVGGDGDVVDRAPHHQRQLQRLRRWTRTRRRSSVVAGPGAGNAAVAGGLARPARRRPTTSPATTCTPTSTPTPTTRPTPAARRSPTATSSPSADLDRAARRPAANRDGRGAEPVLPEQRHPRHAVPRTASTRRPATSRRTTSATAARAATRSTPRRRTAAAPTTPTSPRPPTARTRACRCTCGPAPADARGRRQAAPIYDAHRRRRSAPRSTATGITGAARRRQRRHRHHHRRLRGRCPAAVAGKIALVDRGTCDFTVKVKNAQARRRRRRDHRQQRRRPRRSRWAATTPRITIPAVMVSQADGAALKAAAGHAGDDPADRPGAAAARRRPRLRHRLPRVRPRPDLAHDRQHERPARRRDRRGHERRARDPHQRRRRRRRVLRRRPARHPPRRRTTNYPRTYGDVTGAEVHDDGEVYGAIGWRLLAELPGRRARQPSVLLGDLVDGMNYTPAQPDLRGHARRHPRRSSTAPAATAAPAWCGTPSPSTASASAPRPRSVARAWRSASPPRSRPTAPRTQQHRMTTVAGLSSRPATVVVFHLTGRGDGVRVGRRAPRLADITSAGRAAMTSPSVA